MTNIFSRHIWGQHYGKKKSKMSSLKMRIKTAKVLLFLLLLMFASVSAVLGLLLLPFLLQLLRPSLQKRGKSLSLSSQFAKISQLSTLADLA